MQQKKQKKEEKGKKKMFKMFKKNNKEVRNLYKVTYKFIDEKEIYTTIIDVLTYLCSDWTIEILNIEKA